jgi:hypothetical protein
MRGRGAATARVLLLLVGTVAAGVPVRALAEPPLRGLAASRPLLPLDQLVVAGCAAALVACWLWLSACVWLVAVRCLREGAVTARSARAVRGCPRAVQVAVLLALGAGAATPAYAASTHAAPGPGRDGTGLQGPGLSGLVLPDRVDGAERLADVVRVRPGDSLWRVAQRILPDGASEAAVDRTWRRIAALNADRLGPDPDLIFPGTLLRVPETGRALGKDDR